MSLNIDMNMILPSDWSGLIRRAVRSCWVFENLNRCESLENSIRTQLVLHQLQTVLRTRWIVGYAPSVHSTMFFSGGWCTLPIHKTESVQTCTVAFAHLTAWSWHKVILTHCEKSCIKIDKLRISNKFSAVSIKEKSNNVLISPKLWFWHGIKFLSYWGQDELWISLSSTKVPDHYVGLQVKHLIILRSIQFPAKFHDDFLKHPQVAICRLWWSSLVVCSWISFLLWFPATPELLVMLLWTVSCLQFHAAPSTFVCSFPRLLWQTLNPSAGSAGLWQHLDQRKRIAFFQACWNQSHWLRLCYRKFFFIFFSWNLFDIVVAFSIERKWLRESIERSMMWVEQRRLHHSSRVQLPSVDKSTSWFLVSTFLFWILVSKLILSNKQFNATLWLLGTCLIIGLLLLMIIFITASLSSKMNNWVCFEKNLRLWSHALDLTFDQQFGHFLAFIWCYGVVEIFWVGGTLFNER